MFIPDNYDEAERWIRRSKRVIDRNRVRTMYWYGKKLVRRSPDTIAIYIPWMNCDIATYNRDGTITLEIPNQIRTSWGGTYNPMYSQSVRYITRLIGGFSNVFVRKGQLYITEFNYKTTPTKIQRCRTCKSSGKVDEYCYSYLCYASTTEDGKCSIHPEVPKSKYYHEAPCEHGLTGGHTIPKGKECYYCAGTGKRDYGNKPISLMWDGSPIRVKDGNLVKREPSELEKRIAAYVNIPS